MLIKSTKSLLNRRYQIRTLVYIIFDILLSLDFNILFTTINYCLTYWLKRF